LGGGPGKGRQSAWETPPTKIFFFQPRIFFSKGQIFAIVVLFGFPGFFFFGFFFNVLIFPCGRFGPFGPPPHHLFSVPVGHFGVGTQSGKTPLPLFQTKTTLRRTNQPNKTGRVGNPTQTTTQKTPLPIFFLVIPTKRFQKQKLLFRGGVFFFTFALVFFHLVSPQGGTLGHQPSFWKGPRSVGFFSLWW